MNYLDLLQHIQKELTALESHLVVNTTLSDDQKRDIVMDKLRTLSSSIGEVETRRINNRQPMLAFSR